MGNMSSTSGEVKNECCRVHIAGKIFNSQFIINFVLLIQCLYT